MYNVELNNGECVFDYADGFETFDDALEWANDRTGVYFAQFEYISSPEADTWANAWRHPTISICIENSAIGNNRYSRFNGSGWTYISMAQLKKLAEAIE